MQRYGGTYPKPSLTWGFVRVFALHKIYYGTTRPLPVFAAADHPVDGWYAARRGDLAAAVAPYRATDGPHRWRCQQATD